MHEHASPPSAVATNERCRGWQERGGPGRQRQACMHACPRVGGGNCLNLCLRECSAGNCLLRLFSQWGTQPSHPTAVQSTHLATGSFACMQGLQRQAADMHGASEGVCPVPKCLQQGCPCLRHCLPSGVDILRYTCNCMPSTWALHALCSEQAPQQMNGGMDEWGTGA